MYLNVKRRGDHVATFRWIDVRLMETLAAWVPTTPEMEVKLLFGAHIWDTAQHADALGKRTHELRLPEHHNLEPTSAYVSLLTELELMTDTAKRIAGLYDCVLRGLDRQFRAYIDQVDTLLDAPTVRVLERIMADTGRMISESIALREQLPALALHDEAWLDDLRQREATIDDIVAERPSADAVVSAV
jgi:hypothetical protein